MTRERRLVCKYNINKFIRPLKYIVDQIDLNSISSVREFIFECDRYFVIAKLFIMKKKDAAIVVLRKLERVGRWSGWRLWKKPVKLFDYFVYPKLSFDFISHEQLLAGVEPLL